MYIRYIFLFLFLIFNSNSYANDIIGTKLICKNSDDEVGYYFNRPKSLVRYSVPIYYDGITEKEIRSVYKKKWNYNPSPLKIFMWIGESTSYMPYIDRTNLNLIIKQRNRTEEVIGKCKLMDYSFNMKQYFQEKTDVQYKEIITSKNRKF